MCWKKDVYLYLSSKGHRHKLCPNFVEWPDYILHVEGKIFAVQGTFFETLSVSKTDDAQNLQSSKN